MTPLWFLLAALYTGPADTDNKLVLSPLLVQNALLFISDDVTAGGAGGGVGLQVLYRDRYLAQADLSMLWALGNPLATRLALGAQRKGTYAPAGWVTFGAVWGDRIQTLTGDGSRPAAVSWAIGIRGSPLRFAGEHGAISVLEPGIATDFTGGLWLELTLAQASVSF